MTLLFNIAGLLLLAGLVWMFLRLGRETRESGRRPDRPSLNDHRGEAARRSRPH